MFSALSSWYRQRNFEQAVLDFPPDAAPAAVSRVSALLAADPSLVLHAMPGRSGRQALGCAVEAGADALVRLLLGTSPDGPAAPARKLPPLPERLAAAAGAPLPPTPQQTTAEIKTNPLLTAQLAHRDALHRTPLVIGIEAGDPEMVEMLLRAGGVGQLTGRHGMDWTPLMCGYASLPAVRALFEVLEDMTRAGLGADEGAPGAALPPHTDTPAASASQVSGEHTIDVGSTPTSPTAHITPALLLSHTNEQGQTLLHLAALHASADLVRYLLGERRADLVHGSSLEAVLRQRDASSRTPLMLAASGAGYGEDDAQAARRADVVRTLLSAAASGLAPDAARDALRALLLEDRTAPGGRTAPMLAAENGNTEALSMLLTFPAPYDPDLLDEQLLASDAQGMGMPSLALAARHAKPWLRGRADAVLQLLSQLRGSSPTSGSPGTPVLPPGAARPPLAPLVVANPSRAGRQGGTSLETGMPEMDGRGRSASPGAAVGEVPGAPGLRRKGSNGSRVGEE